MAGTASSRSSPAAVLGHAPDRGTGVDDQDHREPTLIRHPSQTPRVVEPDRTERLKTGSSYREPHSPEGYSAGTGYATDVSLRAEVLYLHEKNINKRANP